MSVYTTVTPQQLSVWLERYDVGELVDLRGIAAGIENTNYFVTTASGRYVLTLFEKLTPAELPYYLGLMAHLADHGVPSARPVPDRTGAILGTLNGKPASLVSFLPGKDIADPDTRHCTEVGRLLAQIHLAGASYRNEQPNPRGAAWWTAVMPELLPFLAAPEQDLLKSEIDFQARQNYAILPRGPIHADLFRDNVLFDGGRITGVIDFYFAGNDALLYDLAITVNDWCLASSRTLDPERTGAITAAYREFREPTSAEKAAWPLLLRAGALRFWVSRLYDYHLPRPGELTHAKDPDHFRDILRSHIARPQPL